MSRTLADHAKNSFLIDNEAGCQTNILYSTLWNMFLQYGFHLLYEQKAEVSRKKSFGQMWNLSLGPPLKVGRRLPASQLNLSS